ncbi:MAG TPA: hypothetical protein VMG60_13675 [Burkholderiaceae bacterium]|nr:hypothetical protein [Burkholderiaceae bacterium]
MDESILLERWKQSHAQLNDILSRRLALERYALLSTGAIWAWLATATDTDWNPAIKWLPFLLNLFFALSAVGLVMRTRDIAAVLAATEAHLPLPPELKLEDARHRRGIRRLAAWAFWPLLLAATLVLPYFYAEHAPDSESGQGQTLTFRSTRATAPEIVQIEAGALTLRGRVASST